MASSPAYILASTHLFIVPSAYKGILEKVTIKQVKLISKKLTNGAIYFLYIDTTNGIYQEDELTTEYNALIIAKQFFEKQLSFTISATKICPY